jgi:hypothetical protein
VPHSTVPFCTASSTCNPGTISPAANTWIWNLLSVISAMRLAMNSGQPYRVSSDFGQLAVRRHLISGMDCAMAGAATAEPARPTPAAFRNSRRFMAFPLVLSSVRRLEEN